MGFLTWWATKAATATVRKSLPNASPAKLVKHYNTLTEAYRMTSDLREQSKIAELQNAIRKELDRRGVKTSGW